MHQGAKIRVFAEENCGCNAFALRRALAHESLEMDTLNLGVVGCGYWGPNLIRNFASLDGVNLKTICDADPSRLSHMRSRFPTAETETEFDRLVNDPSIDAVAVATPVRFHYPMAKALLEAGKHVFIEKPMASSSAECEELVNLAESRDLTLMIGHTFLYSAPIRWISDAVASGQLGELLYVSSRRLSLGLFQKDINVAWDLAPHDISIILRIFGGAPERVNCQGNAHITPGIEDITNMSMSFGSGGFALIQSSWLDPRKVREMTIVGREKMIVYNDVEPLEKIRVYDSKVERPPHYDSFAEFQYAYHYGDCYIPRLDLVEPLKVECQHFVDCIGSGETPISDGRQGWELVRILEAASESMKQNGAGIEISAR